MTVALQRRTPKVYTLDEVKEHCSKGDCWVVVEDSVYDLSKWIGHHPGGELPILYMAGRECTDVFKAFHPAWVFTKKLPAFKIGKLDDTRKEKKETSLSEDFEKLRQEIIEGGGLQTNYWFYIRLASMLALLFASIIYCVVFSNNVYIQVAAGILVAVFWQQMAFIGHDAGHHAIFHDEQWDDRLGLVVGNLLTGVSIGWWKKSHNAHHVVTNSVELDPDIQHLPVLAVTDKFFNSIKSIYHDRVMHFDGLAKFFVRYQHHLYFLIMGLARFNLYAQSFLLVLSKERVKLRVMEFVTMVLFWTWYLTLCSYLPTWSTRFAFVFLAHFLAGIIHIQITLSHFSMETYNGLPLDAFKENRFLLSQMDTTMDIECDPNLDFFHGGLQFQFEHHLFPRVARQNLRSIQEKMKLLCKKHGLPYRSKSFVDANIEVIQCLKDTAEKSKCFSPKIWDSVHCIG
ncbi:predicted protein [Nematostella vectensis]|uniref:Cytochrome b5 heme-binding domain-containing protein n=2 Tax=Nematostella vectensis TaxID=45351 RepID=A7RJB6_NEMVE|nr:delta(8)-fatty-acid desaturase [Nematostella vectensis]XP_032221646.1 delta(8)-fatty-acid desaturase [Nematostella vectensis]EDO48554.1 predicted protein [Nematostella vectensis]|eukprot:XP_001640617.1 predicted protein [Nematostella vectensis]